MVRQVGNSANELASSSEALSEVVTSTQTGIEQSREKAEETVGQADQAGNVLNAIVDAVSTIRVWLALLYYFRCCLFCTCMKGRKKLKEVSN